ncbi:MAG: DUF4438 domain-containing protein [Planctomycetes bacterium]|nr:DUF4438 domain-containing protein [Planctomycetota bacterium]
MIRTNAGRLVEMSLQCQVCHPTGTGRYGVDHAGRPFLLPGVGGITYNVKVGDCAFGWAGDHIEPGASAMLEQDKPDGSANQGLNFLACIGDEARIVSGEAKGSRGIVTGTHGGAEHVLIDFDDAALERLTHDDKILIRAVGQGLAFVDHPDVTVLNLSPALFAKMGIREAPGGKLAIPVAAIVPGMLMGSGVGSTSMGRGDYDIMATDEAMVAKYGLDRIRFGDIVAITDHDNRFGRSYREGAVSIGIVIHSDCRWAGHGPGVTTLISSATPIIEPVLKRGANIADYLRIGRCRPAKRARR